ncbi:MAG TPA: hypothetical protein PKW33_06725 [Anaerolineaceae bacterium]|nr:hypothetical protein [Anaerolineaceae bacterium]HPN51263.1 hypothetical protein [Anaerolineaceae bacterium]
MRNRLLAVALWGLILAVLMLAGCRPNVEPSAAAPTETKKPARTLTPQPSATRPTLNPDWGAPKVTPTLARTAASPAPTPTPTPGSEITPAGKATPLVQPTPGEDLSLLFLVDGSLQRYSLATWTGKPLFAPESELDKATLSPDGAWLAFVDQQGVKVLAAPFDGPPLALPFVDTIGGAAGRSSITFSPDSSFLAYSDDEGLKIIRKPFTGKAMIITLFPVDTQNESKAAYFFGPHPVVFHPDSTYLAYQAYDGLVIYDIYDNGRTVLLSHTLENERILGNTYSPVRWSPDGQWLHIQSRMALGYVDQNIAAYLPSSAFYKFNNCHAFADWSADSASLASALNYGEREGCLDPLGIALISTYGGTAVEKLVYQDAQVKAEDGLYYRDLVWDVAGQKLLFAKMTALGMDEQVTHLMAFDRASGETTELLAIPGRDAPWAWVESEKAIYTAAVNASGGMTLHRFDLAAQKDSELAPLPEDIVLLKDVAGSGWLLGYVQDAAAQHIYLINKSSGAAVRLAFEGAAESYTVTFLGTAPAR